MSDEKNTSSAKSSSYVVSVWVDALVRAAPFFTSEELLLADMTAVCAIKAIGANGLELPTPERIAGNHSIQILFELARKLPSGIQPDAARLMISVLSASLSERAASRE
jgi:hypothetical protein